MATWAAFALAAALAAGYATGRTHRIEVAGAAPSLERMMPHSGPYARGVLADAEFDFAGAALAYDQAADELMQQGQELLAKKAIKQRGLSHELVQAPVVLRQLQALGSGGAAAAKLPLAVAYHEKFLGTRAFLGRAIWAFAGHAQAVYRDVIESDPDNVPARLGLASLLADLGQAAAAQAELAQIPAAQRREEPNLSDLARYYAAAGQIDEALRALRERRRPLNELEIREMLLSNRFDRLRRDPRFLALIGEAATAFRER